MEPFSTLLSDVTAADGEAFDSYVARVHPEDVEHVVALVDLAEVNDAHVIVRVRDTETADWRLVEHRARPGADGLVLERTDVTAREQDRLRISRTEAYWRTILRNGHEAIVVIDPEAYTIRHASDHLGTLTGQSADALVDRPAASLLVPEDRLGFERAVAALDGADRRTTAELRLATSARSSRWVEAVFSDARDDVHVAAIVVNMRDIEDRKRAEQQLRSSEQLFRVLLDHLADGALVVDEDRVVRFSSRRFAQAMRTRVDQLVGQPYPLRIDRFDGSVRLSLDDALDLAAWDDLPTEIPSSTGRWYELTIHDPNREPVVDGQILVFRDVTEGRRRLEHLRHELEIDDLTGLLNRRGLERRVHERERDEDPMWLAFIDLNGFKKVNDTHGHAAGDELLQRVGARLRGLTRPSDLVARLGGDEFVIVAVAPGGVDADRMVDRYVGRLSAEYQLTGQAVTVGVSVGYSELGPDSDFDRALRIADERMYAHKRRQGRHR